MRGTILVTPRSLSKEGHPELKRLTDAGFTIKTPWPGVQPSEEQLLQELPLCVAYLAGVEKISHRVLTAAPNLQIISRFGVGVDNIDLATTKELGIEVAVATGANSQGVAELALSLIFDGMRAIAKSNAILKTGQWKREMGMEIADKTLGIAGCGNIGKRLANLALALGMRVIAYDLYEDPSMAKKENFSYGDLPTLLSQSDFISLHTPLGNQPLLNKTSLGQLKGSTVIVNTARDGLIDHLAMLEALDAGLVSTYLTDVFDVEPLVLNELYCHERVVLTPHIGGYTKESVARTVEIAVDAILDFFTE
ncbi:MAG: phosphoglycerate dehydrogenase [Sphaerochaeta sp.]|jgi:D-3-phosphoglycerate dehydrogenase